jgi:hypothetical protein
MLKLDLKLERSLLIIEKPRLIFRERITREYEGFLGAGPERRIPRRRFH